MSYSFAVRASRVLPVGVLLCLGQLAVAADAPSGLLRIEVSDAVGKSIPCRIHLFDAAGKPQRAAGLPFWKDHFVCTGRTELRLSPGAYHYEIERGPEHQRLTGDIQLEAERDQTLALQMGRIAELSKLGWYPGDLHIHRPPEEIELLMAAEDLAIAPVITWWNKTNLWDKRDLPQQPLQRFAGRRFAQIMAGEDERGGGALLFFHLDAPLAITAAAREFPSPLEFVAAARQRSQAVWIDVEKPFWWDAPEWVASGQVDSIGLANNHMCRSSMYVSEAWGKPRDRARLPDPTGNGQWTQEIYYHFLNCGIRLPPSAGSASGVLPNPVGYNRVYVHVDGELEYEKWWAGLKAGQSFVTNGPLLLCRANGELPGHVFQSASATPFDVVLDLSLDGLDSVPALEVVQNGKVAATIAPAPRGSPQPQVKLTLRESGWFLIRALADNPRTFRFASTAPYYVEIGPKPQRISRSSAQFFLDWINERIARLQGELKSENELRAVVRFQEEARQFWQDRVARADAE